jgi:hypothetical protein
MGQGNFSLTRWFRTPYGVCLLLTTALAALYLTVAHMVHVLGALPYLLILLCPILHLFMHSSHGHHGDHNDSGQLVASKTSGKESQSCH